MSNAKAWLAAIPGVLWIKRHGYDRFIASRTRVPVERPSARGRVDPRPIGASTGGIAGHRFILYRIIGNDLVPRHRQGQSRENLRFILEHEPELEGCEKRFVVNRIVDPAEEAAILELLEAAGAPYVHLPFRLDEYARRDWDVMGVPVDYAPHTPRFGRLTEAQQGRVMARLYRHKNNYAINNNGARNAALDDGAGRADWVMPWDGNCFLTAAAWAEIRSGVLERPELPYWVVPMARVTDNGDLLHSGFRPAAEEEPQLLFRSDASLRFDERFFYGRRPKVELLWRLGVPGKWNNWPIEPWDLPCPDYDAEAAGHFGEAGWVARLYSGQSELEVEQGNRALVGRGLARVEAITGLLDRLDEACLDGRFDSGAPVYVSEDAIRGLDAPPLLETLRSEAEAAVQRGPYSVVDKRTLPPSGDPHDYWHPAPYYWPNPLRIPGLPYVRRDGRRVPGTRLYEPLSDNYDRTRLQRLFDDTFVLALAAVRFGDTRYGEHAARLVRTWFIDPATAMTPHLNYAQVRRGYNGNLGNSSGVIEMKDLYYFLDAVRLLSRSGYLKPDEDAAFRVWLRAYLSWLRSSPQGQKERSAPNNHGTYYDLQVGAIAAYLGESLVLRDTFRDSLFRLREQFRGDGSQPREMERNTTAHYCCFNLQGWIHLAQLAESAGYDLWAFRADDGQGLSTAMEWLLAHMGGDWPYPQIDAFDSERFYPVLDAYRHRYDTSRFAMPRDFSRVKALFHPHDGVRPFWQVAGTAVAAEGMHREGA
ncbi:MAG: alginate lyase family protein [Ectothiorhodospiraceae bacterium]|nr:alginate lyase family protein [Ectothiorhodospiraceae bacterium]